VKKLVLALCVVLLAGGVAFGAETMYVITIVNSASEECGEYAGSLEFKTYVEEASGGRIKVQLLFNGVMGNDRELLESVQLGNATVTSCGNTQWTNFLKDLTVIDSPFLFKTEDEVYALYSDKEFKAEVEKVFAKANYKYMGMSFQGFRTLTSNREIRSLADMTALSIRVIESPTPMALWKALATNPTPLAFTEIYTALQQGTVEAQETPLELTYSQRFYEQQKYIINTKHQIQPAYVGMNLDFYNNLPADLQAIVDEGAQKFEKVARAYTKEEMENYKSAMLKYGCTFIDLTDADHVAMYEATQSIRDNLAEQFPEFYAVMMAAIARTQN
jgi:tripartite ATP-independent transporter DctP family solute receptor